MTCKVLIVGLMLFAVFLPLAAPLAVFVLDAPVAAIADLAAPVTADLSSAAFVAVTLVRGPPSR